MGASEQGARFTDGRWLVIPRCLCFVRHGGDILLMKRAAHKRVFPNRYNGLGGHLERDESPLAGARREIWEETGLAVRDLRLRGLVNIDAGGSSGILLYVCTAEALSRDFVNSEEGTLEWVGLNAAYALDLVEDLPLFLPRLYGAEASNQPFSARVYYDAEDQMVMVFDD